MSGDRSKAVKMCNHEWEYKNLWYWLICVSTCKKCGEVLTKDGS